MSCDIAITYAASAQSLCLLLIKTEKQGYFWKLDKQGTMKMSLILFLGLQEAEK